MYIQKISADLSSNICSGNWNTQIRQAPDVGTAEQICILHATKSPIHTALREVAERGKTYSWPKEGSDSPSSKSKFSQVRSQRLSTEQPETLES